MSVLNGVVSPGGGGGGVTGLTSAAGGTAIADNKVVRGDGTTGIQGSVVDISDAGVVTAVTQLDVDNLRLDGNTISSTTGGIDLEIPNSGSALSFLIGGVTTLATSGYAGLHFRSDTHLKWANDGYANTGTKDTGLARAAAGVVKVTDGSTGNGSVSVASGSAGSPSIRFTDDSDTGFCQTGSGRVQATVNGAVALTIYDSATGIYPAGPVVGAGASATLYGFVKNVEANTAGSGSPNVLAADETGKVFTNEGVTAENYHTLPTAAAGYEFTFVVQDTDGIRITAAAGDTIRPIAGTAASATGGFIRCATAGAFIRLQAINATEWIATGSAGVWTIDV